MKIEMILNENKIILIFPSEDEASFFYSFLKAFRQIQTKDTTQGVRITEEDIKRYIEFLKHKPRKPIKDPATIKDYVNSLRKFMECSNQIINPDTLIKCIKNKHYASAISNYLYMKYYYKEIGKGQYNDLLERIPRHREQTGIAQDRIPVSEILLSLGKAAETKYNLIYYALFYTGGTRLEQLIPALKNPYRKINNEIIRLKVKGKGTKQGLYAWMPYDLYVQLKSMNIKAKPKSIGRYFNLQGLTPVTLVRSFCWQTAKQILDKELALLLQGRVGELSKRVTARHYDDLIFQLDMRYNEWKQFVDELISNATLNKNIARNRAKHIINKYKLIMPI